MNEVVCSLVFPSQICQLKAETLEKDKEIRNKLQSQQKSHNEVVENLQVCVLESSPLYHIDAWHCSYQAEMRTLRKQLSQASQKKTTVSSTASQNSSLASLASSLAPNISISNSSGSSKDDWVSPARFYLLQNYPSMFLYPQNIIVYFYTMNSVII